ncbi:hypothetical protein K7432_013253 [Basidiobolus ranarum]|uniref:Fatty acid hydroxylase domain-containing protein n=1 Tax=Basidiobolus ranarum TaxID=34480 RepID=A0ABR2VR89_9FUNG
MIPLLAGPLIMNSHMITVWIWLVLGIMNAVNSHCGFALPGMPSPLAHDFHHQQFNNNFGVLGFLDFWHGTNLNYLKYLKQRDLGPVGKQE